MRVRVHVHACMYVFIPAYVSGWVGGCGVVVCVCVFICIIAYIRACVWACASKCSLAYMGLRGSVRAYTCAGVWSGYSHALVDVYVLACVVCTCARLEIICNTLLNNTLLNNNLLNNNLLNNTGLDW